VASKEYQTKLCIRKNNTMKTTHTDAEVQGAMELAYKLISNVRNPDYIYPTSMDEEIAARLNLARAFLANLPETQPLVVDGNHSRPLSQLRPLSEAGPVPEGCQRYYFISTLSTGGRVKIQGDTHFADIRLPDEFTFKKDAR
jgi:hypothetical protein